MEWIGFILAFVVFFLSHSVPVRPPVKPWLVDRIGARGFSLAYSALSLAVLWWLLTAASRAPYLPIWNWAPWQAYVPLIAMLLACIILCASMGRPNPFSFGGSRKTPFDPANPGLVRLARHPLLFALALWSAAHLVPNGDLAHIILFGIFTAFALLGGRLVDRRKRREMGQSWHDLQTEIAKVSITSALTTAPPIRRVLGGVAVWAGLLLLHPIVFGVSPLPHAIP